VFVAKVADGLGARVGPVEQIPPHPDAPAVFGQEVLWITLWKNLKRLLELNPHKLPVAGGGIFAGVDLHHSPKRTPGLGYLRKGMYAGYMAQPQRC
jgi:hypothetical protein